MSHVRPTRTHRLKPKRTRVKRKSRNSKGPRFLLGLDLGQVRDYTAMVIVERIMPKHPGDNIEYHLRHMERFELGTPYPEIVDEVSHLLNAPELRDCTSLIVDGTGVGIPVVEMFLNAGLSPTPIWITGGESVSKNGRIFRVPKRDLVSVLQVCFQTSRLKISSSIDMRDILVNELMNFKVKITKSANDTYGVWREGIHDDLVLALSMACWCGEQMTKSSRTELYIEGISMKK